MRLSLGRTLADGQNHEVRWELDRLDRTIAYIKSNAGSREVELNALVQSIVVTDDRDSAIKELLVRIPALSLDSASSTPFLAIGNHDEIAAHLVRCRERWGISYFSVRSIDDFQPVIERLKSADN